MNDIRKGVYAAPDGDRSQPPLIVVDDGRGVLGEFQGPWIRWRHPWSTSATETLLSLFEALIDQLGFEYMGPDEPATWGRVDPGGLLDDGRKAREP